MIELVSCMQCSTPLYRIVDGQVRGPSDAEFSFPRRPVEFVVAQKLRVIVCSSECAERWFRAKATSELLGGYPIF
jgi:hypothetical protein